MGNTFAQNYSKFYTTKVQPKSIANSSTQFLTCGLYNYFGFGMVYYPCAALVSTNKLTGAPILSKSFDYINSANMQLSFEDCKSTQGAKWIVSTGTSRQIKNSNYDGAQNSEDGMFGFGLFDNNLDNLWYRRLDVSSTNPGFPVFISCDRGVCHEVIESYNAGVLEGYVGVGYQRYVNTPNSIDLHTKIAIMKTDVNGGTLWQRMFVFDNNVASFEQATCITQLSNGNYAIGGVSGGMPFIMILSKTGTLLHAERVTNIEGYIHEIMEEPCSKAIMTCGNISSQGLVLGYTNSGTFIKGYKFAEFSDINSINLYTSNRIQCSGNSSDNNFTSDFYIQINNCLSEADAINGLTSSSTFTRYFGYIQNNIKTICDGSRFAHLGAHDANVGDEYHSVYVSNDNFGFTPGIDGNVDCLPTNKPLTQVSQSGTISSTVYTHDPLPIIPMAVPMIEMAMDEVTYCTICNETVQELPINKYYCPLYENSIWINPCSLISPAGERYRIVSGPNIDPNHPYDSETGYYDQNHEWHHGCNVAHEMFPGTYILEYLDPGSPCVKKRITLNIIAKPVTETFQNLTINFCKLDNNGKWINPCDIVSGYNKYKILPNTPGGNTYYSEDGFYDANHVWHGHCEVSHFFEEGTHHLEFYNDDCEKMNLTLIIQGINPTELAPESITIHKCELKDAVWYEPDLPFAENDYSLTGPNPAYNYHGPRIAHALITGNYVFEFHDNTNCVFKRRFVTVVDDPALVTECVRHVAFGNCPAIINNLESYTMPPEGFTCMCQGTEFKWFDQNNNEINPAGPFMIAGSTVFRKVLIDKNACTKCTYVIFFDCPGMGQGLTGNTTGLNNTETAPATVAVIPNPSSGIYTLTWNNGNIINASYDVEITNTLGELVYSMTKLNTAEQQSIDLSDFASGVYTLRITVNGQSQFIKLIKN